MRTRCGPLTALAATFAVVMSTSRVRLVIHRQRADGDAVAGHHVRRVGGAAPAAGISRREDHDHQPTRCATSRRMAAPSSSTRRRHAVPLADLQEKNTCVYNLLS